MSKFAKKYKILIFSIFFLTSCSTIYKDHGYLPVEADLKRITIGEDSRNSVFEVLGPPSGSGVLKDGSIFYVTTKLKNYLFYKPVVVSRNIVVVSFNEKDLVKNIERFTLEDGRLIVLSQRVTTTNVKGPKILSQILGNIGNIDAENIIGN